MVAGVLRDPRAWLRRRIWGRLVGRSWRCCSGVFADLPKMISDDVAETWGRSKCLLVPGNVQWRPQHVFLAHPSSYPPHTVDMAAHLRLRTACVSSLIFGPPSTAVLCKPTVWVVVGSRHPPMFQARDGARGGVSMYYDTFTPNQRHSYPPLQPCACAVDWP